MAGRVRQVVRQVGGKKVPAMTRGLIGAVLAAAFLAGCGGDTTPGASISNRGQVIFTTSPYSCAGTTKVGWTANLTDKVGGLKATLVYARKLADGAEQPVIQGDMPVSNPDFDYFSNDVAVSTFCTDPFGQGDYIMRIVRPSDSKVLAEGSFTIAP